MPPDQPYISENAAARESLAALVNKLSNNWAIPWKLAGPSQPSWPIWPSGTSAH